MTMSYKDNEQDFLKFYKSKQWEKCRRLVLERDNYMCVLCKEQPAVDGHHIVELTKDNLDNPNITLNTSNLISLCVSCHNRIHMKWKDVNKRGTRERIPSTVDGLMFDADGNLVQVQVEESKEESQVEDNDIKSGDVDNRDDEIED